MRIVVDDFHNRFYRLVVAAVILTLIYIYMYVLGRHFYLLKVCSVSVHGLGFACIKGTHGIGVACVKHIYAKNH